MTGRGCPAQPHRYNVIPLLTPLHHAKLAVDSAQFDEVPRPYSTNTPERAELMRYLEGFKGAIGDKVFILCASD